MDHMVGHKTLSLNQCERIETTQNTFSDYNAINLDINNTKISRKSQNI